MCANLLSLWVAQLFLFKSKDRLCAVCKMHINAWCATVCVIWALLLVARGDDGSPTLPSPSIAPDANEGSGVGSSTDAPSSRSHPLLRKKVAPYFPTTHLEMSHANPPLYLPSKDVFNPVRDYLVGAGDRSPPTFSIEQYLHCVYHLSYNIDVVNSRFRTDANAPHQGSGGAEADMVPLPEWCRAEWIPKEELFQGLDSVVLVGDSTMLRLFHDIMGTDPSVYYVKLISIPDQLNGTLVLAEEAEIPPAGGGYQGLRLEEPSNQGVAQLVADIADDEAGEPPSTTTTPRSKRRYRGRLVKVFFLRSKNIIDAGAVLERAVGDGYVTRNSLVVTTWGTHDTMWLTHRLPPPRFRKKQTGSWSYAKGYWNKHLVNSVGHIGSVLAVIANASAAGRSSQRAVGEMPRSRLEWDETTQRTPRLSPGTRFDAPVLVQKEIPTPPCEHFKYASRSQISRCPDTLRPAVVPWHQHTLAVLMGYAWAVPTTTLEPLTPNPCNLIDAGHFDRRWKVAELQMIVQAYRLSRRLGITQGPLGGTEAVLGPPTASRSRTAAESVPMPMSDGHHMRTLVEEMNRTTYYYNRFAASLPTAATNATAPVTKRLILPQWASFAEANKGADESLEGLLTRVPLRTAVPGVGAVRLEIPQQDIPGTDLAIFNTVVSSASVGRPRHDLLVASYYHHDPSDSLFVMNVDRDVRVDAVRSVEVASTSTARSRSDFSVANPKKHHAIPLVDEDSDRFNHTFLEPAVSLVNLSDYTEGGRNANVLRDISNGSWRLSLPPTIATGVFSLSQLVIYTHVKLTGDALMAKGANLDAFHRLRAEVLAAQRIAVRGMPGAPSPFFDSPLGCGIRLAQQSNATPNGLGTHKNHHDRSRSTPTGHAFFRADNPSAMFPLLMAFVLLLCVIMRRQRRGRVVAAPNPPSL